MHLKLGMEIQTHEKSYHSSRIRFTVMFRDRYLVTGNQIEEDKARFDPSLETFDKEILRRYIDKANESFRIDVPVI